MVFTGIMPKASGPGQEEGAAYPAELDRSQQRLGVPGLLLGKLDVVAAAAAVSYCPLFCTGCSHSDSQRS